MFVIFVNGIWGVSESVRDCPWRPYKQFENARFARYILTHTIHLINCSECPRVSETIRQHMATRRQHNYNKLEATTLRIARLATVPVQPSGLHTSTCGQVNKLLVKTQGMHAKSCQRLSGGWQSDAICICSGPRTELLSCLGQRVVLKQQHHQLEEVVELGCRREDRVHRSHHSHQKEGRPLLKPPRRIGRNGATTPQTLSTFNKAERLRRTVQWPLPLPLTLQMRLNRPIGKSRSMQLSDFAIATDPATAAESTN